MVQTVRLLFLFPGQSSVSRSVWHYRRAVVTRTTRARTSDPERSTVVELLNTDRKTCGLVAAIRASCKSPQMDSRGRQLANSFRPLSDTRPASALNRLYDQSRGSESAHRIAPP